MIARYLCLLTTLLECPREIKVEIYTHLLLAPHIIKKVSSTQCRSKAERYAGIATDCSCCHSVANKFNVEEITTELKDMEEPT